MPLSNEIRQLFESVRPMDVPAVPCTDCEWSVEGKTVTHGPMCAVAMCIDEATAGDRRWFESHPFADHYFREMTWGEGAQVLLHDDEAQMLARSYHLNPVGKVRVDLVSDGERVRRFQDVYYVITGEREAS